MELIKLNLKNFRTHRKLELNFQDGITGIVGDNGTGKSSIVEAIIFLFTGEGYGPKADMLSVGEESGYVIGNLKVDGKEAVLERHLDTSKVAFKYDGVTYKKSGEVAEIWEKLFQIDKNIFKNIVVAKQGDIALLFSGDTNTKEKIFQKIFLVPNTTKIRDAIWNKYIKTAPPEYPPLDEVKINLEIAEGKVAIEGFKAELSELPTGLSDDYAKLLSRMNYLDGCKKSALQRESINLAVSSALDKKNNLEAEIEKITTKLSSVNIVQISESLEQLKANKPLYDKKQKLETELVGLESTKPQELTPEDISALTTAQEIKAEAKAELDLAQKEHDEITKTIADYTEKGLVKASNCPYCGSQLQDINSYISHLESKIPALKLLIEQAKEKLGSSCRIEDSLNSQKSKYQLWEQGFRSVSSALAPLEEVTFDQSDYEVYTAVVAQYKELELEKASYLKEVALIDNNVMSSKLSLSTLPNYDFAKISIDIEVEEITKGISEIRSNEEKLRKLELNISMTENMLKLRDEELKRAEDIKDQNKRRNRYVGVLTELYDILSTSQFPRRLIQTYSATVSEYLTDNLRQFNFPYRAEVNDNFGIDVYDTQNRKLPSVSGGQEIMIGMALRLALHSMFGEAFPMMIFDEGSVHLSQESKKSYFEIIRNMKTISKFKQVIIIDHDEDLTGVVDNTIKL